MTPLVAYAMSIDLGPTIERVPTGNICACLTILEAHGGKKYKGQQAGLITFPYALSNPMRTMMCPGHRSGAFPVGLPLQHVSHTNHEEHPVDSGRFITIGAGSRTAPDCQAQGPNI